MVVFSSIFSHAMFGLSTRFPQYSKLDFLGTNVYSKYSADFTSGHSSGTLSHLDEFGVDLLLGLPQDVDQFTGLFDVARCEKSVCCTSLCDTPCAANAVNIVLGTVGVVKVHHKLDVVYIYLPRKNKTVRTHSLAMNNKKE